MKRLVRATFLSATMAVFAGHASLASAQTTPPADAWPQRPVRMVVPFPPGGGTDPIARIIQAKLAENTGWNVVVENKPGAAGVIGATAAAKAAPDGQHGATTHYGHSSLPDASSFCGEPRPWDGEAPEDC